MQEVTVKLFEFEELPQEVQERVVQREREKLDREGWYWLSEEISWMFSEMLAERGLPNEDVRFSLTHCQGDGVAFYGDIDIQEYIEKNEEDLEWLSAALVHEALGDSEGSFLDKIYAQIEKSRSWHHYDHHNTMVVRVEACDATPEEEELAEGLEAQLQQHVKEVSRELEEHGYRVIEHAQSDESIRDMLIARGDHYVGCPNCGGNLAEVDSEPPVNPVTRHLLECEGCPLKLVPF